MIPLPFFSREILRDVLRCCEMSFTGVTFKNAETFLPRWRFHARKPKTFLQPALYASYLMSSDNWLPSRVMAIPFWRLATYCLLLLFSCNFYLVYLKRYYNYFYYGKIPIFSLRNKKIIAQIFNFVNCKDFNICTNIFF